MTGPFCTSHSVCLNIDLHISFVWKCRVFNLNTFSFLKRVFVFQKTCFKSEVLKTFKISSDCHIKTCQSLKRRAVLKIPGAVFLEKPSVGIKILLLLALKLKLQEKAFSCAKTKTNGKYVVNLAKMLKEATVNWTELNFSKLKIQHLYSLICSNITYRH